jgi:hypothetical protein
MLKRLIQWLKDFFQALFGSKRTPTKASANLPQQPPPPLSDTDLEFLFTELLEGVHQARGQAWALKWLHNIEHRVPSERWVEWLQRFGEKLLASSAPNNELAVRMVQLGELEVGEVGDVAYNIGMQLLTRNEPEPIWEYAGADAVASTNGLPQLANESIADESGEVTQLEDSADGDFQTITLDQLYELMQSDENLRHLIAQQVGIETDDPEVIIQALVNQFQGANEGTSEESVS